MREAIPQLKTLNNGIYNDNQKLKELIQSGDEKFFDTVYGHLGGYKYRGRGYIQITGKANYENVGKIIGEDLVKDPDLILRDKKIAAKAAAAYLMTSFGGKSKDHTKGLEILNSFKNKDDALNFVTLNVHRGGAGLNKNLLDQQKKEASFNQQVAKAQEKEYLVDQEELPKAAKGGIFSGPKSGYPVMLHGDEAVLPIEGSATKQDLPNSLKDLSDTIGKITSLHKTMLPKSDNELVNKGANKALDKLIFTLVPELGKLKQVGEAAGMMGKVGDTANDKQLTIAEKMLEIAKIVNPTVRLITTIYDIAKPFIETNKTVAGPTQTEIPTTKSIKEVQLPEINEPIENLITTNYQQVQQSNQQTIDKFDQMLKAFNLMTDKLTDAVDLLEDSKKIQNGLLSNSIN